MTEIKTNDIDEIYKKIMKTLRERQRNNNEQNSNDENIQRILNFFKQHRTLKNPHSFVIIKEVVKALKNKEPFYAKYIRIDGIDTLGFDNLFELFSPEVKDLRLYTHSFSNIVSLRDKDRSVILTPVGIFAVNVPGVAIDFGLIRTTEGTEFEGAVSRAFTAVFSSNVGAKNLAFNSGYIALTADSVKDEKEEKVINEIVENKYPWRKKRIKIEHIIDEGAAPDEFRGMNEAIDEIDILYRGDGKKNIVVVPPEKISVHIGKLTRFYFDPSLDKSKLRVFDDKTVDISGVDLPNLKKRKIPVGEKVTKKMELYNKIVKIDESGEKFYEEISFNNDDTGLDDTLLRVAYREKDIDIRDIRVIRGMIKIPIYPYSAPEGVASFKVIIGKKHIMFRFPDSIIKVSKKFLSPEQIAGEIIDPSSPKLTETLEKSIYKEFNIDPKNDKDSRNYYIDPRDGILFNLNKTIGDEKKWTERKINVETVNVQRKVLVKRNVVWIREEEIKNVVSKSLKEKIFGKRKK